MPATSSVLRDEEDISGVSLAFLLSWSPANSTETYFHWFGISLHQLTSWQRTNPKDVSGASQAFFSVSRMKGLERDEIGFSFKLRLSIYISILMSLMAVRQELRRCGVGGRQEGPRLVSRALAQPSPTQPNLSCPVCNCIWEKCF